MPSKAQAVVQMADEKAREITGSYQQWTAFLTTAARLYKYPYHEQLMIFAQRPDATACASYDLWNKTMGRYVRRGSKGIALVDPSGQAASRLRYVFDVADTGGRANSRQLNLWQLEDQHIPAVQAMLAEQYDVPANTGVVEQLDKISAQLAEQYWRENMDEIIDSVDGSFAEQYDVFNAGTSFRDALRASVTYSLLSRCGMEPTDYLGREDFLNVFDWNTPAAAAALASAASSISEHVLRQIEVTVKNTERSLDHERTDLHPERQLHDSQPDLGRAADQADQQVRDAAETISSGASSDHLQPAGAERQVVQPSDGDRADGGNQDGADHERVDESGRRDGADEGRESDDVGQPDEQPAPASRGDNPERADLHLTPDPDDNVQLSFFPSEDEQIAAIDTFEAESITTMPFASSISQDVIDLVLRAGSNTQDGRLIIANDFVKQLPIDEIAQHMREIYHGGFGMNVDGKPYAAWYSEDGIKINRGNGAQYSNRAQTISWEDAAARVGILMEEGHFLSMLELAQAPAFERHQLAEALWFMWRDLTDHQAYLPLLNDIRNGDYPHEVAWLANQLGDEQFLQQLYIEFGEFHKAYQQDRNILRFHYHRPTRLYQELTYLLMLPRREYVSETIGTPQITGFITEDEVNAVLNHGSGFSGSKMRISQFFARALADKDKANFLKKEYGDGGYMPAVSGNRGSSEDHNSKGIILKKEFCEPVVIKWPQVAKRIDDLIRHDRYLTPTEKEVILQEAITAAQKAAENSAEEKPVLIEQEMPALSQTDIDTAIQEWNGTLAGKHAISRRVREEGMDSLSAEWLKQEYGDDLPAFPVTTENAAGDIPWEQVSDHLRVLIDEDRFYTDEEQDRFEDIDFEYLRERLAQTGMMENSEVLEPEIAATIPFVQEVNALADAIAMREQALPVTAYTYHPGDTVYLDQQPFTIDTIDDHNVSMRDDEADYPVFRLESKENLDRLLAKDDRNQVFLPKNITEPQLPLQQPAVNYRITDDHLGEGGVKTKFSRNVAAIHLLKQLEDEGRHATPEEQEILAQYVGWGGIPQAFDQHNAEWHDEYETLFSLLTPAEYEAARASTLNAHYTSPTVIRAIYDAVEQMGFKSGNVLEPACGIGNFLGLIPDNLSGINAYGVELDSITGRIAQQLYPQAHIDITGFEKTDRKDFFDLAVGNVPFGNYKVADKQYDRHNFFIHDYFFAKALDQVRPGGVIAFITSKGTLDKQSPDVRKYIAQRADLLGAIRLPNNTFRANAGTEVTSDIIFLQKRDQPLDIEPDWVHLGHTPDGVPINQYFVQHPQMVLGTMVFDDRMYGSGKETACIPIEGANLAEQLAEAVKHIGGEYQEAELPDLADGEEIKESIPARPDVRNFSYTVVDQQVYYRTGSIMVQPSLDQTALERVKGMVTIRDTVRDLMRAQIENADDNTIHDLQATLNQQYDNYTDKFGLLNSRANARAFSDDSAYYLLCSLEILDDDGNLARKADMFSKRTIRQQQVVDHTDTAVEALTVSISERACVDLSYMAELTGKSEEEIVNDLHGVIFQIPGQLEFVTADEYLSGNVREKLREAKRAAEHDSTYQVNVDALTAVQPQNLEASDIDVRLGATWIDKRYIQQFVHELLATPPYLRRAITVSYAPFTAEWHINGKSNVRYDDVTANITYGTDRIDGYEIIEETLNLKDVRIFDTVTDADGKERRVLNSRATTLAQQKQNAIKEAFRDWIWKDPQRREALVTTYNEHFNSIRPREYDGSHIAFAGMNPEITLREHQRNAIAHVLYGGNTLLAHVVGAGKTFEMVASAMESKRLGLCTKPMFVVPNHLTEQWAADFLRLYPSANILVTTKKDFEKGNRKKFCSRIATGDYDAVIIGHSQFERIPMSQERQERQLRNQIDAITEGIEEMKYKRGEQFTVKQLEKTKRQLVNRLQKLHDQGRKDDVITFEQLGVDRLFVDEAHSYKNLFLYTKMRNVAGLSTSEAQKSSDMFMKCQYLDEITGSKGVVFATGTPISNSMTEMYTMQRYLQYDTLKRNGLTHFDAWASTFGETTTAIELAPEGTGYRARTRFAKFFNLPELMTLFKETADIKTADQLNLPTPNAHFETVVVKPSEYQQEIVQQLSQRAAEVHSGSVDPSVDNMLKITSDGRKLGLDQRLINPLLPDDSGSKVNTCVDNIMRIWREGQADKLTQLVFCDLSTPKSSASSRQAASQEQSRKTDANEEKTPDFSVYEDIRCKLIAQGVPPEQIAFIHDANTEVKKKELFAKVRSGEVRVLMGSTAKMGAGTNVQDRLIALHDLDAPWRPGDLEQRAGRIVRQGNMNPDVHIYRYVTEATFDAYLWVRHEVA